MTLPTLPEEHYRMVTTTGSALAELPLDIAAAKRQREPRIPMSRWAHPDTRWLTVGCLGCAGALGGAALASTALLTGRGAPSLAWPITVAGLAVSLVFVASLLHSRKRVSAYQQLRNERANTIRDQVLKGESALGPYFVYLRPFKIDGAFVDAARGRGDSAYIEEHGWPESHHDLESALALLVHGLGDLVALSDEPGRAGAGYVRSTDGAWRDEVQALCERASGVFIVPFDFEGTAWEVGLLAEREWLNKTFFVMPAMARMARRLLLRRVTRDYRALWDAGRARYASIIELPDYDERGGIVAPAPGHDARLLRGFGGTLGVDERRRARQDQEALRAHLAELAGAVDPRPDPEPRLPPPETAR
jgi:hypothetical protein